MERADARFLTNTFGGAFYDRDESFEQIVQEMREYEPNLGDKIEGILCKYETLEDREEIRNIIYEYVNFNFFDEYSDPIEWIRSIANLLK